MSMNRREALKAVAAALPIGCAGSELAIEAGDELIAFKVTTNCALTCAARENLKQVVKDAFAGTKWAEVPVLVCDDGIDIQVVKRSDISKPSDTFNRQYVANSPTMEPVVLKVKPLVVKVGKPWIG